MTHYTSGCVGGGLSCIGALASNIGLIKGYRPQDSGANDQQKCEERNPLVRLKLSFVYRKLRIPILLIVFFALCLLTLKLGYAAMQYQGIAFAFRLLLAASCYIAAHVVFYLIL